jgi:hypothetical protein
MLRNSLWLAAGGLVLTATLAFGCGDSSDTSGAGGSASSAAITTTAETGSTTTTTAETTTAETTTTSTGGGGEGQGGAAQGGGGAGGDGSGGSVPGVEGVVVDEAGAPIASTQVLACSSASCLFGSSDAEGRFFFELEPPLDLIVKTLPNLSFTPRRAAAIHPVQLLDASTIDVGELFVASLPAGANIGPASADPQTLAAGDGLELTLNKADMHAPLGQALIDVAARRIPDERVFAVPDLVGEEVVAMFALHPFTGRSDTPIGVRAALPVPAGTTVYFRTFSELDGHVSAPAQGTSDGSFVETDPGEGIDELTWLVISK